MFNVYSAHCHMVDFSDFICGKYMFKHLPCKSIRYLVCMACIPNLVGIFVSMTYLAITREACIAAGGCVFADICKNVGSINPFNMLFV